MQSHGLAAAQEPDAFLVHAGEAAAREAWRLGERLRDAGLACVVGAGGSFKSQMKKADASRARFALVIGDDEAARGVVGVKPLREAGEQESVAIDALPARLAAGADE
jgi:histidyl-tRNA synthetase